ncbi:hypothetical protein BSKO_03710 [Bryopsis sp. KO-2023]|nr:hypothetical protein BSKO_03710 [Bryopsis sp. KO-2023]
MSNRTMLNSKAASKLWALSLVLISFRYCAAQGVSATSQDCVFNRDNFSFFGTGCRGAGSTPDAGISASDPTSTGIDPLCICFQKPCETQRCPAHPLAVCQETSCCKAEFFLGGSKVDCSLPQASFQQSNPCGCSDSVNEMVCGVNGETFGSSCKATCEGVAVACKGICPCRSTHPCPVCTRDPCFGASCPAHTGASCQVEFCKCNPYFVKGGKVVDCDSKPESQSGSAGATDFSCSDEPEAGHCQWGTFGRWFYDILANDCKVFPDGQCGKSQNNFQRKSDCQNKCARG